MKKKKILFFLMSAVGGAERMTVTFAKQLDKTRYEVVFCLLDYKNENGIMDFIPQSYRIIHLASSSFGANPTIICQIHNVLRKEKPDMVFSSLISINFRLLLWAPFFRKTKFIVRNNIDITNPSISRIQKSMIRWSYNWAHSIIAQTQEMKEELIRFLQLDASKIYVIQNPIDTQTIDEKLNDYEPFMDKTKTNYVAVGRYAKGKAFDVLVKAFDKVMKVDAESELFIIGRYDETSDFFIKLKQLIKSLSLESKIHIVGYSNNPYKYMKNADCFVLASRSEGLPNALIEAQYVGTPAAACTCIPIIKRIVDEGKTGFLADVEDYDGLAKAMVNASKLGRIKSAYNPSSFDKFIELL